MRARRLLSAHPAQFRDDNRILEEQIAECLASGAEPPDYGTLLDWVSSRAARAREAVKAMKARGPEGPRGASVPDVRAGWLGAPLRR